jgi:hypothetical protein
MQNSRSLRNACSLLCSALIVLFLERRIGVSHFLDFKSLIIPDSRFVPSGARQWYPSVCVLVCVYWCVCTGVGVLVCVYWCVCTGVCILVCVYWCVYTGVCVLVCVYWCVCTGVCVCTHQWYPSVSLRSSCICFDLVSRLGRRERTRNRTRAVALVQNVQGTGGCPDCYPGIRATRILAASWTRSQSQRQSESRSIGPSRAPSVRVALDPSESRSISPSRAPSVRVALDPSDSRSISPSRARSVRVAFDQSESAWDSRSRQADSGALARLGILLGPARQILVGVRICSAGNGARQADSGAAARLGMRLGTARQILFGTARRMLSRVRVQQIIVAKLVSSRSSLESGYGTASRQADSGAAARLGILLGPA